MKHELLAGFLANARRLSTLIDSFPSVEDDPDRVRLPVRPLRLVFPGMVESARGLKTPVNGGDTTGT
jgi:hypothetical protein